jgi:hypothetical protein
MAFITIKMLGTMKKSFEQIFRNVFVITIERNKDRRQYMEKALQGLRYSFCYGLDLTTSYLEYPYVANMPQEVFDQYDMDKSHCLVWTKGQFGAFATERKLIADFADANKEENLTILLDDLVFEKDWKENLIKAYNELPGDWDALILSTRLGLAEKRLTRFFVGVKRKFDPAMKANPRRIVKKYSRHLDTCHRHVHGIFGIMYSPAGLQKFVNEPDRLRKDQDDILIGRLIEQDYLNVYVTYPLIGREGIYDGSWTQKNEF